MKRLGQFFLICSAVVLLGSCAGLTSLTGGKVTLVYSGNLDGELEPCGCSEGGNKGGILRRATKLDELRSSKPGLVLISTGGLLISDLPQDSIKSEFILSGLATLNYDAMGVQWRDLAFGVPLLENSGIPFVASNWDEGEFETSQRIARSGVEMVYFQWLDPKSDPLRKMSAVKSPVVNRPEELKRALQSENERGRVTILGTTLTLKEVQKTFDLQHIDILLIKSKYEQIGEPRQIGKTLVLQPGSRGMRLGELDLMVSAQGEITKWEHAVHALPPTVQDSERLRPWYDDYNAKLKEDYAKRVELKKQLQTGESPYAGSDSCQSCHAKEYAKWYDTRHAEAFYALQDVNKAFDPNCIGCHTVGFEKTGGFIDPAITPKLLHVQCESCHGGAADHVSNRGATPVQNKDWNPQQMCAQCHIQKHSPDFVFEKYWPLIRH
ncbi:MAG: multiheme c-type cytochrome [Gammaproteobacteria bacterium]|nr:multiheme c-type cytochrome [Gammaproteobacteria bacterium]